VKEHFVIEQITFEQNALSPENGKREAQSAERRAQSAERRAQSAERRNARVCWLVCKMKLSMMLYNVAIL